MALGSLDDLDQELNDYLKESRLTRRKFMRRVVPGAILLESFLNSSSDPYKERREEFEKSIVAEKTPVAKYSDDILAASQRLLTGIYDKSGEEHPFGSFIVGVAIGAELSIRRNEKIIGNEEIEKLHWYKKAYASILDLGYGAIFPASLSGDRRLFFYSALGGLTHRILDNYSTLKAVGLMEDPRFREYGFNTCIFEGNDRHDFHPSFEEMVNSKELLIDASAVVLSYALPVLGFGFWAHAPFLFRNNMITAKEIEVGYKIGDKVKEKLKQGKSEKEINNYLETVSLEDLT